MAALVVAIAFSRVSAARLRGLSEAWLESEGGSLRRRVEKRWRRCSDCESVSETKAAVWKRIWEELVVVMVVVITHGR